MKKCKIDHRLEKVARYLGVSIDETHRAMADVEITVSIMKRLLDMAEAQKIEKLQHIFKEFGIQNPNYKIEQLKQATLF